MYIILNLTSYNGEEYHKYKPLKRKHTSCWYNDIF